jgi:hypothetical protein
MAMRVRGGGVEEREQEAEKEARVEGDNASGGKERVEENRYIYIIHIER